MNSNGSDTAFQRLRRQAGDSVFASLRVRLLALVLLSLLPAVGLIIYTALEQRHLGARAAREEALRVMRFASRQHEHVIESARQFLVTLSQVHSVQLQDAPACQTLFSNLLEIQTIYANIGGIRMDGEVYASGLPILNPINLADRKYFQLAINQGGVAMGEYQVGRITGKGSINLAYPTKSLEGQLNGVIYVALDLNYLKSYVTNANLPPQASLTIVDVNGTTILRHPDPKNEYTGRPLSDWYPQRPRRKPEEYWKERASAAPRLSRDGVWRLYASGPLEQRWHHEIPSRISVGIPLKVAYADANRMLIRNLVFLAVVVLLATSAAWFGGNWFILRRVRALLAATRRLSAGDLTARTGIRPGRGELRELASAFDEMAGSLQERVAERERAQAELRTLNEDLEKRVQARTLDLKRSNEDLEQFAYVASHDLQEPLRMVTQYLQLLEQRYITQLDSSAKDFMAFALDGAQRMQQLIQDLLTYSRVGTRAGAPEQTDAGLVLEKVLANLKFAIEESAATIVSDPLPQVLSDPMQLGQVLQNILSNAIKFRSEAPPRIQISVRPVADARATKPSASEFPPWYHFWIKDNGIGIEPSQYERIFIVFQRLHARDKYPGTGIGLAICKKIIERHGGQLWVESRPGEGTTFHFTVPGIPASRTAHSSHASHTA